MIDFSGRMAFVKGVEMDSINTFVEQPGALLRGIVDANSLDCFGA